MRTSEIQLEENEGPKAPLNGIRLEAREWNLWEGTDIFEGVRKEFLGRAPGTLRTEDLQ